MTLTSYTLDASRSQLGLEFHVAQWALDSDARQINAFDHHGRLLMAIPTSPLFAARLAAAFGSPPNRLTSQRLGCP